MALEFEGLAGLERQFAETEARKRAALKLKESLPGAIRAQTAEQRGLYTKGAEASSRSVRGQAARALAGALAQSGTIGGAGFAQGRQTAIETGEAIGKIDAGLASDLATLSGSRQEAIEAEIAALEFAAEIQTPEEEARDLIAAYRPEIQRIINRHKGLDDDEAAMATEILDLMQQEPNPIARQWLENEAYGVMDTGPHARDV